MLFFSWSDASVAKLPGQFAQLHDKTDALYFNVSTLATVGFGDVHPVGQLARAAVTLQIVFNLVFLGAAVSMITGFFRTGRARFTRQDTGQGNQTRGNQARGRQHGAGWHGAGWHGAAARGNRHGASWPMSSTRAALNRSASLGRWAQHAPEAEMTG